MMQTFKKNVNVNITPSNYHIMLLLSYASNVYILFPVILEDVLKLCTRKHPAGNQDVSSDCESESSELKHMVSSLVSLIQLKY